MTDIADRLVHSRSGLTYQVSRLAESGLVAKESSPEDERSVVVALTPKGRELLGWVMTGHVEVVRRIFFTPLSDEDVTVLGEVLGRVRDHMRAVPPRSAAPRRKRGQ
ncbi:MarR family winged helix-turn-helix transcriptional regulator [Streptacidiphilus monticola]